MEAVVGVPAGVLKPYAKGRRVRLPNNLPSIMARLDLSNSDLAELAGVKQPLVARWKAGWVIPTVTTAIRIARCLDVSVEDVWGEVATTQERRNANR